MSTKKKILVTGGHLSPAMAVMERLQREAEYDLVFVGEEHSVEYDAVSMLGVRFLPIIAGRFTRVFTLQSLLSILKVPVGFKMAFYYVLRERPALVVSFGGFVALPVAIAAWILGVPVITHEQTRTVGLTNRILAGIAKRVCVTFPDMVGKFPKGKTVLTGLPIRRGIFSPLEKSPYNIEEKKYPLLYITGGSLGAVSLNRLVYPIVKTLTKTWTVIHQVGADTAETIHDPRCIVEKNIPVEKLAWVLAHAGLVVGRSGANTVMEVAALGNIALFVPLPWAAADEQMKNAQWLATNGGAMILPQQGLTSEKLLAAIQSLWTKRKEFEKRAKDFAPTIYRDADIRLIREIKALLP